jgi:1-aminocyclopropane-1-carboxylate deaminase/D-cysteine desulfhydrase-like pyridoxal-dependent ACC family enzyme
MKPIFRQIQVRGRTVHIKRDDLFEQTLGNLTGNKARKLALLTSLDPLPPLVSFGGFQSNAMAAIAQLSQVRRSEFLFYLQRAPTEKELARTSASNFKQAKACGTIFEVLTSEDFDNAFGQFSSGNQGIAACTANLRSKGLLPDGHKFVPQGAAMAEAEFGFEQLADEICTHWQQIQLADPNARSKRLQVVLPAGTGTSALFLARHVSRSISRCSPSSGANLPPASPAIDVITVPCVGDVDYLRLQMQRLDQDSGMVSRMVLRLLCLLVPIHSCVCRSGSSPLLLSLCTNVVLVVFTRCYMQYGRK